MITIAKVSYSAETGMPAWASREITARDARNAVPIVIIGTIGATGER